MPEVDAQTFQRLPGGNAAFELGAGYAGPARVAIVVNTDRGFLTHRAVWAAALAGAGSDVRVFAPDTGYAQKIRDLGFEFHDLSLGRESIGGASAAMAGLRLLVALLRYRPSLVFLVQTAAYVLGWPAALLLRGTRFVRVAGGIGRALASDTRAPARLLSLSLRMGAKCTNVWTLFQLEGDRDFFLRHRFAAAERSTVVGGTGIDTAVWAPSAEKPQGRPTVLFASRLYDEKGVREFVEVARRLHSARNRFVIVGEPDPGVQTAVSSDEVKSWAASGILEWWGHQDDMLRVMQQSDLIVFPSRHPEGTPKTLIEAAACGVPAVAADQEGCRAVVEDDVSGWIRPATDVDAIAKCVQRILDDPAALARAASFARSQAVARYSLESVLGRVLEFADVPLKAGVYAEHR